MIVIPKIKTEITDALEKEGWTIETLALATEKELIPFKGIGIFTAKHIIIEARKITNSEGLAYSAATKRVSRRAVLGEDEGMGEKLPLPPMSERIKRIHG